MDLTADVLFADGQDNMAGLTKRAFIGFISAFLTIQKPVSPATTYAEKVKITTAHVLKPTMKTVELYVMYDKSGVDSPLVGPRKGKSYKPKMTLFYPGNDAECIGFQAALMNGDFLSFAEQQDGDGYIQVGSEKLPCSLVAGSVKTGVGPEGEKGITFEVEAPSRVAYYLYTATLPRLGA